ncbi:MULTISPECIES: fumarylacetoacetate hydrolase family protein [unclassified Beijerinckia]|uniref:fumarylacetoacetate hydrolase family protein n=1 Tax=unclassified Beijerinckia TaxID=2638183 RepID=UPI00089D9111|nr:MULTISPECIES: fumarylacetoacetate hydrolase family protein [unclassified Beijerinckia]MDH7799024.1 2,4-diketo-3-deoxy-L-fuconate hydrolase [Beijerinckia sp. GAS462]SED97576.1 2-keto-4-pentenoate hydratase/2-oxohepta-3-ene-1,7-dioic acid hydratase (catechol pathway) [Beijerinckia sp. 28-YEA-48]
MSETPFHLGTFAGHERDFIGLVIGDRVCNLLLAAQHAGIALPQCNTVTDLLSDWGRNFDLLVKIAAHAKAQGTQDFTAVSDSRPLPPLGRAGKMICAAANYSDHVAGMRKTFTPPVADSGKPLPPLRPYAFGKLSVPTGAYNDIILPEGMKRIDWEAELMVVIGTPGYRITQAGAAKHIAGYMTTNDVSCRDLTWRDDRPTIRTDWLAGKSFDTFAPVGPYFTPKAFVPDHANVAIKLWVNGAIKQDGNSRDMTFGIEEQIEYASRMMTLLPGDMLATGTPAGTGQERGEFLQAGDIVEAEVQFCGRQRNRIVGSEAHPFLQSSRG